MDLYYDYIRRANNKESLGHSSMTLLSDTAKSNLTLEVSEPFKVSVFSSVK